MTDTPEALRELLARSKSIADELDEVSLERATILELCAALAQRPPTDTTEALPPLPPAAYGNDCTTEEEAYTADQMRDYARAALAQRQQVPEGWTMRLDADAAETLKQTIGDDDTVSEITLSLCDGHEGRGLYVWLTEYPEEGSLLLAAAPALTAAPSAQAEPQVPLTDEHISALWMSGWGAYCSRSSFIAIFREAERVHRIGKQEGK